MNPHAENMPSRSACHNQRAAVLWAVSALASVVLFPMLSLYGGKEVCDALKNAFLIGVAKLPRTLPMAVIQALPLLLAVFAPQIFILLSPLWIAVWFSLAAFLCARIGGRWYTATLNPR